MNILCIKGFLEEDMKTLIFATKAINGLTSSFNSFVLLAICQSSPIDEISTVHTTLLQYLDNTEMLYICVEAPLKTTPGK